MVEISDEDYKEFMKYKQKQNNYYHKDTCENANNTDWSKFFFKLNSVYTNTTKNINDISLFVKEHNNNLVTIHLKYGKQTYLVFNIYDSTDKGKKYYLSRNVADNILTEKYKVRK
jgi:hypothetical protein